MTEPQNNDRLDHLLSTLVDGALSPAEADELTQRLRTNAAVRQMYIAWMTLDARLRVRHAAPVSIPGLTFSSPSIPHSVLDAPTSPFRTFARSLREAFWHPIALLLIVGFVSAGILAYVFSKRQADQPVVQNPMPAAPAAKLIGSTDAKWAGPSIPDGEGIKPGQRLILQRGSAEIVFGKQARVICEAPADFVITDSAACRLDGGKLTAHVPEPARGFKVHTPDGTVTDLGTEFGVYVKSEVRSEKAEVEEQQEDGQPQEAIKLPPITEVHVFKGQVDITTEQLSAAPESKIQNPKSKIVSAGQAVTISDNKVQPLPAADPFKFALDKLQGKPRTVLLSEDFESYPVGRVQNALGPWIVQSGTRKGQGVAIDNFDKRFTTDHVGQHALTDKSLLPLPPSISQVLTFIPSPPNPPQTFPRLAHAIDAPQLAHTCQVLVEFVMIPVHPNPEPSLALATEAGPAPGIDFWRNADPAAPRAAWDVRRCYRFRILLDVVEGTLREARVTRSAWRGIEGWVRDADYRTPVPKVDWSTSPRFVILGYPMVSPQTPPGVFSIDNVRMEMIAEK